MTIKPLSLIAALVAGLMLGTAPVDAGDRFRIGVDVGSSSLRIGDGGVRARINLGKGSYHRGLNGRSSSRYKHRGRYEQRGRFDHRYDRRGNQNRRDRIVIVPERERTIVRVEPPRPDPQPVPSTPVPQPVLQQPLDPQGGARIVAARGQHVAPVEYELGAVLPSNRPHVTLDHRRYGLPEPPAGQIYARVGRDVLRIDPSTRQIIAVVAD